MADGFEKWATGVRQIMCKGNKSDVPHTINIVCPFTGATFEILCTITGRQPICLRCCHHGTYGHTTESCASQPQRGKSYASAASSESAPVERDRQTGEVGASVPGASAFGPAAMGVTVVGVVVEAAGCEALPLRRRGQRRWRPAFLRLVLLSVVMSETMAASVPVSETHSASAAVEAGSDGDLFASGNMASGMDEALSDSNRQSQCQLVGRNKHKRDGSQEVFLIFGDGRIICSIIHCQ